jgi:cytochrome P450
MSTDLTPQAGKCPISFDHYDHALQDDPYPTYARMREEAPLYYNEEQDFWVMSRHSDLHKAFRTDDTFSNKMGVSLDPSAWNENAFLVTSFLGMDPPQQTRLRKLVSRGFTPKRVADLEPRITEISARYLDAAIAEGSFDWIGDFAGKFPMDVISEMLGVPTADRDEVRKYADLLVVREDGLRDVPPAGFEAAGWLFSYYAALIADRKANPGDDLVSALISVSDEAAEDDGRMTDQDLTAFLFLMVVAGNETTTKLLGNAVANISSHPDQREAVFADPSLVEPWIEETLRYEASSQLLARLTIKDFTIGGVTCPAGSKLMFNIGAANHDHEVFENAEEFDIRRDKAELAKHIAFGGGRHFCLGANLARLEARIALEQLVARCSSVEVTGEPKRFYSANVRGYASLPVTVTAL